MRGGVVTRETTTPAAGTRFTQFDAVPEMPGFGATIEGLDLRQRLSETTRQELRQALLDFEVLFFPPQTSKRSTTFSWPNASVRWPRAHSLSVAKRHRRSR